MAIVYRDDIAGKICANPECGWKPLNEFGARRLGGFPVGDGYKSRCKDCFDAQKRAERAARAEKYRETARKYVVSNRDHIREIKCAHRKANPAKYDDALRKHHLSQRAELNVKARERREQSLEHYREIGRKSREKHADERNFYQREYGRRNRDKLTLFTNRRRARKYAAGGSHTEQEWQVLKAFYEYRCLCTASASPKFA